MHPSALAGLRSFLREYDVDVAARVIELGSREVDGGARTALAGTRTWVGVDLESGPGVDVVLDDPYRLPFADGSFDVAVATSVFEHDQMFWLSFLEMVRVVRAGGLVYVCSPSNGHIHRFPVDCYRFHPDAGGALATWAVRSGQPVTLVESLVTCKQASEWNDWIAVFRVGTTDPEPPRLHAVLPVFATGPPVMAEGTDAGGPTQDQVELEALHREVERLRVKAGELSRRRLAASRLAHRVLRPAARRLRRRRR